MLQPLDATWSPANTPYLEALTDEIFLAPFADSGAARAVHLQNTGNSHPLAMYADDGRLLNAYNRNGPIDEKTRRLLAIQDTRMIAPTRGNTVIRRRHQDTWPSEASAAMLAAGRIDTTHAAVVDLADPPSADFIRYLLEHRLIQPDDLHGLLFAADVNDYDEVLRLTAQAARPVVPYNPLPDFIDLCARYGIKAIGSTVQALTALNDKTRFRNLVEQLRPGVFAYPRLPVAEGQTPSLAALAELIAYSETLPVPPTGERRPVLFAQRVSDGGGAGNFVISRTPSGYSIPLSADESADLGQVAEFIATLGAAEVTPYLPVVASPSIGMLIGSTAVSLVGPCHQILNSNNDYAGVRMDRGGGISVFDAEMAAVWAGRTEWLRDLAREIAGYAQKFGYLGYGSLDLMIYHGPGGELHLSIAETNLRYTGTCQIQMLVHTAPDLRERYLDGALSMLSHNLVRLSAGTMAATQGQTSAIAQRLSTAGIPLLGRTSRRGVVLMARPADSIAGMAIGVGVIADTDDERDTWLSQVRTALS